MKCVCGKGLKGKQRKFCSHSCKTSYYQKQYPQKREERRYKKLCRAVDYKGGICEKCGRRYHPICYDFHHTNPDEKEYQISTIMLYSWQRIKEEIDKCQLLCANCHAEEHYIEREVEYKNNKYKDNKYNHNKYMNIYHRNNKLRAIEHLGGKCKVCGYDRCSRALCFHHRNPEEKKFTVSSSMSLSWKKLVQEVDKCDLVCIRCHRMVHFQCGSNPLIPHRI